MHRVTLVFILFLLIPDLYIYLVYVVRKTRKAVLHCLYWLPTLLLAAGYVYFIFLTGDNAMSNHTQAIGRLAITIMLFVFPKTIFMLCSLVGILAHFIIRRCPHSPFTAIGLVLAVVSFFNILYGTLAGITRFDTKKWNTVLPIFRKVSTATASCKYRTYTSAVGKAIRTPSNSWSI